MRARNQGQICKASRLTQHPEFIKTRNNQDLSVFPGFPIFKLLAESRPCAWCGGASPSLLVFPRLNPI